jgi:amidophosphoribosyltransferase
MCGIIGILLANEDEYVNQLLFDGLTVLQHRGQDAAGMVTIDRNRMHLRKDNGLVKDVFHQHHMDELAGNIGLGHCRYPTAGSSSCAEAQPLYTNYPYGICVAHNGNLTNTDELLAHLKNTVRRHVNTDSDSELLLNIFAESMTKETRSLDDVNMKDAVFSAIESVMKQCKGGYAGLYLINGFGLVGFRDPHGIRPLTFGVRNSATATTSGLKENGDAASPQDYAIVSESVALDTLGFKRVR